MLFHPRNEVRSRSLGAIEGKDKRVSPPPPPIATFRTNPFFGQLICADASAPLSGVRFFVPCFSLPIFPLPLPNLPTCIRRRGVVLSIPVAVLGLQISTSLWEERGPKGLLPFPFEGLKAKAILHTFLRDNNMVEKSTEEEEVGRGFEGWLQKRSTPSCSSLPFFPKDLSFFTKLGF